MTRTAAGLLALAIVWAAVIFASAGVLRGTPYWDSMLPILGGGAAASILIVGAALRRGSDNRG
jgi:hypothetical protein